LQALIKFTAIAMQGPTYRFRQPQVLKHKPTPECPGLKPGHL
jgi:hypothetical protein